MIRVNPKPDEDIVVQVPDEVKLKEDISIAEDGTVWIEGALGSSDCISLDNGVTMKLQAGEVSGLVSAPFAQQSVVVLKPEWWNGSVFQH